jgi:hypothetical protein
LKTNYFVFSQRYKCSCCKELAKQAKLIVEACPGLDMDENEMAPSTSQYTFMGYDPQSVKQLPHGYGRKYPAFHMHKSAVDMDVVNLLRPLHNGVF